MTMKTDDTPTTGTLAEGIDILAPSEYIVRYLALRMFLAQDDGVSYNKMSVGNRLINSFASEDEFNKAYNFVFDVEPLL